MIKEFLGLLGNGKSLDRCSFFSVSGSTWFLFSINLFCPETGLMFKAVNIFSPWLKLTHDFMLPWHHFRAHASGLLL